MQFHDRARRLDPAKNALDEQHRFAVELHGSRQSIVAALRDLPPDCHESVLKEQGAGARGRNYWPYAAMEACCGRLRKFALDHPDLDVRRVAEQVRRSWGRLNRAREALILANLGIVPHVVKEYHVDTIPMSDMIQDGYVGLLLAIDRFDPYRGAKFSTYAVWWIRRELNDAFRYRARLIRLPDAVRRDLRQWRETNRELKRELDRDPTTHEMLQRSGFSPRKIKTLLHVAPDPGRLEDIAADRDGGWQAVVADDGAHGPFEATLKSELEEQMNRVLNKLKPRERRIIEMRFGFGDGMERTLSQIARSIGVSRERVRQIEGVALEKMNRWAKNARIVNC
jgi:RNA polymerase primary sigma factor